MDFSHIVTWAQTAPYGLLVAFVAIAVWAFYTGKIHSDSEFQKLEERAEHLEQALQAERQRGDAAVQAGSVTNQLIGALKDVAAERRDDAPGLDHRAPEKSGLTAKDLGL